MRSETIGTEWEFPLSKRGGGSILLDFPGGGAREKYCDQVGVDGIYYPKWPKRAFHFSGPVKSLDELKKRAARIHPGMNNSDGLGKRGTTRDRAEHKGERKELPLYFIPPSAVNVHLYEEGSMTVRSRQTGKRYTRYQEHGKSSGSQKSQNERKKNCLRKNVKNG